jgi:hypothetical protein
MIPQCHKDLIPRCHKDLIPRYHWHRGIESRGVNDTAESASTVSLRLWHLLKKCPSKARGVIDTAESECFKLLSRFSRRKPSHMRNGFSPWIGALMGIVCWKTEVDNLVTLSLKFFSFVKTQLYFWNVKKLPLIDIFFISHDKLSEICTGTVQRSRIFPFRNAGPKG